jgi:hypothetical protein
MNPEWITAIGTVVTALVIAASACAALVQIRHMRGGNQIAAYNECRETMDTPEFREALHFIRSHASELRDAALCERIVDDGLVEQYGGVRLVANFFETMGLFARTGLIDERIACELWSATVSVTWNALSPVVSAARKRVDPGIWENFEYMAVLAKHYNARFPNGEYPRGVERMPLEDATSVK